MFSLAIFGVFSILDYIIFGLGLTSIFLFGLILRRSKGFSALQEQYLKLEEELRFKRTDFKYTEDAIKFLDKLIEDKYNFYMYTVLIPIYLDHKIPEKKIIHDLKEKIYVSVVGGLQIRTKKSILEFFTEKGIEIYIHEKILVHMNKTDFKTAGKYSEAFRELRVNKMDVLIP